MEKIKRNLSSIKKSIRQFHTKKPQLEFFTALLTIPVLLTVVILNLNNLRGNEKKEPTPTPIVITGSPNEKEIVVTKEPCKAGIGSISIDSPSENDELEDNPVMIDVSYKPNGFCEVVWSYRINGGRWSDYDDRSIALYNLTAGNIKFELRVKSVVNSEQKTLTRNFVYKGSATATPSPTASATITPTTSL